MNGILLIDKPQDFTSFDVVAKMRGIAHTRKIGHSGTLDPMATGVLPLLIGNATKACDILPCEDKAYRAGFLLGKVTDTQDSTGTVLSETESRHTEDEVREALKSFTGTIMQVPPMYSAVSIGGKRLYELAHQGIEIERPARPVVIYDITLEEFCEETQSGFLSIHCGKGTYVRTLCHDLGEKLGCGGIMTSLRRTMAAGFSLSECITLEEASALAAEGKLAEKALPAERLFEAFPVLRLAEAQLRMYKNGIKLDLNRLPLVKGADIYRIHDSDGSFLGLAKCRRETEELIHYKNFAIRP